MENTSVRIFKNTRCLGPKVDVVWKFPDFLKSFEDCNYLASKEISLGDASFKLQVQYKSNETYEWKNQTGAVFGDTTPFSTTSVFGGITYSGGQTNDVVGNTRNYKQSIRRFNRPTALESSPAPTSRSSTTYLCIQIERNWKKNSSFEDHLMVNPDDKLKEIAFTVGILDNNDDLKYAKKEKMCGFSSISLQLVSEDELISNQSTLLPDLTISCKITSWVITQETVLETKTGTGSVSRVEAMIRDFGELLFSENTSDVKILVNDKEIPVHSQILSARSPVFAAMFRSNMEEYRTKIIDIKDARETIVRYLLKYIYTGSLPDIKDMSADTLIEMYVIADKYSIMDLKDMVMDFISRSLSEDNMEKYLSLGMQHEDQAILQSVSDFVTSHHNIIRGEIWRSLARKMPDFGFQVFDRYCKRFDFV